MRPQFIDQMEKEFETGDDKTRAIFHRIACEARVLQADYKPIEAAFRHADARAKTVKHREQIEFFADEVIRYSEIALAINDRLVELLKRTEILYGIHCRRQHA